MQKKYLLYILIILLILITTVFFIKNRKSNNINSNIDNISVDNNITYLLDTYPIKDVPLYKLKEVSSCKLFNNWDPRNTSIFGDEEFSYYNVVLYTDSTKREFLEYYKNLFDEEIIDDYPMPDMVQGYVGKYRVTASHYDSNNTAYIQVHLPNEEFNTENIYFDTYPQLFEEDGMFVEHENSYGLLNQVGGQTEYTKYYTVIDSGDMNNDGIDDIDEFAILIDRYQKKYSNKPEYSYDNNTNLMSWDEDGYTVRVSFTKDHGRVYLNIRGSV